MMLRHFGSVGLAMVAAWLPGWAGWLSGVRLEAPRREVPPGVGGNRRALGPYPDSKIQRNKVLFCIETSRFQSLKKFFYFEDLKL